MPFLPVYQSTPLPLCTFGASPRRRGEICFANPLPIPLYPYTPMPLYPYAPSYPVAKGEGVIAYGESVAEGKGVILSSISFAFGTGNRR